MSKFSILAVFLLAATSWRDAQGSVGVPQALEDHQDRIECLEVFDPLDSGRRTTVTLRVENSLDPNFVSCEYQVSVPVRKSVFQTMVAATRQFDNFTFRATYFPEYAGHFIDSINGLAGSSHSKTYWRFENGWGEAFDRGVDLILVHANDDVIVFRYTSWA
ncbi:PREDICTED: uncharacterized protein LOC109466268 isoform X3 [Branchiostoma belcheri]|uniref:Uncharacterized protein LOC109466268 isoform X3 n=1 Tax=Branchiostoma belcheri TaxID=7741 RepID=A0A6P4YLD2_BRABE|nr:PREDICTED: uncharacterized protein LOC109466268 isoform X3 [Branchiostoma belcheri]